MEEGQTTWGHVDFHKVTKGHEKPGEGSTAISGSSPSGKMSPVSEPGWAPHHVGEEYLGRGQERARSAKAQAHSAALEAHLPLQLICYCSCHFPLCSVTSSLLQHPLCVAAMDFFLPFKHPSFPHLWAFNPTIPSACHPLPVANLWTLLPSGWGVKSLLSGSPPWPTILTPMRLEHPNTSLILPHASCCA